MELPNWAIAVAIKPFVLLFLMVVVVYPIKLLFQKYMKEGPLKRLLFKRIN